jgi:outer membrane protein assembly factor BamB
MSAVVSAVWADDWPNFRGPHHDGVSAATGLKVDWNEPLAMVWDRNLGEAFSSFAIVGGRAFTCGTKDDKQALFCLDAETGETVWEQPIERAFPESHGGGTRATPTVDDGRVYIFGAHGRLVCFKADTGEQVWDRSFGDKPTWGYSGSVLIEGDHAIVTTGGSNGALTALDKRTGERIWATGSGPAGYATPYPFTHGGVRYLVAFLGDRAIVVEAEAGREVWSMAWETSYAVNASSPIYHDGYLFLTAGYQQGCVLLKLSTGGGGFGAEPVWRSKVLLNKFQSCILRDGNLFTSDQRGFKCVDFATGDERWNVNRIKHGTLVMTAEHLLLLTESGELQIGPVSPDGFTPTMSAEILSGRCWTVPVLSKGRIYARNLERVVCFDLRAP